MLLLSKGIYCFGPNIRASAHHTLHIIDRDFQISTVKIGDSQSGNSRHDLCASEEMVTPQHQCNLIRQVKADTGWGVLRPGAKNSFARAFTVSKKNGPNAEICG